MISRFTRIISLPTNKYANQPSIRYQINNSSFLQQKIKRLFSQEAVNNNILSDKAEMIIRNSETFELKLYALRNSNKYELLSVVIQTNKTLGDLKQILIKDHNIYNVQFFVEQGVIISSSTPLQALMNQYFILFNGTSKTRIQGQLFKSSVQDKKNKRTLQLKENLQQLQLPVFAQRQIQAYIQRTNLWLQAKYGPQTKSNKSKMKARQVQDILVQAILDPQCKWKALSLIEEQWQNKYWQVAQLREKKQLALKECTKMVQRRMYMGLGLIGANIGFIWSGTYVFYSWDIIQPIAYFISSLANIIIFGHVIKLRQSFSLQNYKSYLTDKYMIKACQRLGFNLTQLEQKQIQLSIIEATLKDHLISKL